MNERETLDQARLGGEEACRTLYDRFRGRIYRSAYRSAGNAEDAEDIMQETFIRAFRALSLGNRNSIFLLKRYGSTRSAE